MSTLGSQIPIIPGPVLCAKDLGDLTVMSSPLPNVGAELLDWFRPMIVGIATTLIAGDDDAAHAGEAVTSFREQRTQGVIKTGDGEVLSVKAEGERSWDSAIFYCLPDLNVPTDTLIRIEGTPYRVMEKKDRSASGFIRYVISQDYASRRTT